MYRGAGLTMALACLLPVAAQGQIAGTASVSSDDVFRGRSVSQALPTLDATLSWDDASGIYANASVAGVLVPGSGPDLLSVQGSAGYAHRLGGGPILDIGIVRAEYRTPRSNGRTAGYTELYLGLLTPHISSHVYLSPDYFRPGATTLYGDVDAVLHPLPKFRVTGHAGLLAQVGGARNPAASRSQYDVQIGAGRQFDSLDLHVAWTMGGPDADYYGGSIRTRNRVLAGATITF